MNWIRQAAWLSCSLFFILTGCNYDKIDNSLVGAPGEAVVFSQDVLPIFLNSCSGSGCHIGGQTSGVELTTYSSIINSVGQQYNGRVIVPGDAANSPLINKILSQPRNGARMPLGRTPLTGNQISIIRTWIDDGAKNE
jgi:hypothetical protein